MLVPASLQSVTGPAVTLCFHCFSYFAAQGYCLFRLMIGPTLTGSPLNLLGWGWGVCSMLVHCLMSAFIEDRVEILMKEQRAEISLCAHLTPKMWRLHLIFKLSRALSATLLPFLFSGHHSLTTKLFFKGKLLRILITSSFFMSVCLFGIPCPLNDCFQ